ncbi:uncharacterized protein IL334_002175 [Kwoniella shivajii]|uniref:Alpha/beta hydrolase fold-3 domain-containing protein n=1 Tax=Kwoniella shivajii TaxID=564305 RepID=A0ABZ1CY44_9TREE|nr:hypothetical protein IL334_002175 [Kwoniella shivajii]
MSSLQNHSSQPLPLKHLLRNYTTAHPLRSPSPLPPSSRVDPTLTQRLPPPTSASPLLWTLSTWWLFLRFVFTKGLHVIWNLLCHFLFGPKRKSWGYRMTFITSFMRNIADHSSLADIVLVRRFISLHFLVPLPGDAVVTPITFKVPLRKEDEVAKGFLKDYDILEDGNRELSGEWVVGTDVWKKLKAERKAKNKRRRKSNTASKENTVGSGLGVESQMEKLSTIPIQTTTPTQTTDSETEKTGERVIYYVHGGAYYVGNAATHRLITIGVSKSCNARVFAITYRLAPEHAFPLPLHDVLQGYLRLLSPPLSIPPENIIIAGDSAGGGLSLALCMYLRDEGYKLPAGLVLMSPWVDLTMSCGSWDENAATDVVPRPEADDHLNPVGCYLGPKGISTYLTHPYASPLFGDLRGLPPMLIQSGDSEVLRDEITLLAHKATLAGVHVTHELYEDMVHVFQMFSFLPATTAAINNVGKWVCQTLPSIEENIQEKNTDHVQTKSKVGKLGDEIEKEMATSPRVVAAEDGEEVGLKSPSTISGRNKKNSSLPMRSDEFTPVELDYRSSRLRTPKSSGLRLDFGNLQSQQKQYQDCGPTVDIDSLPTQDDPNPNPNPASVSGSRSRSRSRSITPTISSRSSIDLGGVPYPQSNDPFSGPHTLPRLRRSYTANITPTLENLTPSSSPNTRRRRRTTYSLHVSPAQSITSGPSNPTSPTPSIRRRLRGSTISHATSTPSTRSRSDSHSDIFQLVEDYVEDGPANTTTVIDPEGEVISTGVLGEDEDEDDF